MHNYYTHLIYYAQDTIHGLICSLVQTIHWGDTPLFNIMMTALLVLIFKKFKCIAEKLSPWPIICTD